MDSTRYIVFIMSLMMLTGCRNSSAWLNDVPDIKIDFASDVEWIDVPTDSISDPEMMVAFGEYLLWVDNQLASPVRIFDGSTGEISSPVQTGRASNEMLDVQEVLRTEAGFALEDTFKKRLYFYQKDTVSGIWEQSASTDVSEFCWVSIAGDTVVGQLMDGTGRYGVKSPGQEIQRFGDYSQYGLDNASGWGLMMGHSAVNAVSGRYAVFSCYTGAYEIVDYRDTATVCSKVLEMSSFNDHKGRYLSMRPDSKTGFISVASNTKYIYALYDGKELSYYMSNPGIGLRGHDICVFDWDGNYVFRLHSADPVRCISWNEERQSLYLCVLTDSGEYRFGEIPYAWFQDIEIHKEHI